LGEEPPRRPLRTNLCRASRGLQTAIFTITNLDEHLVVFDFYGIDSKVYAGRSAFGLARREIELPIVLGAFNDVVHHKPVGKMNFAVRA
jgi:hypothetical protein